MIFKNIETVHVLNEYSILEIEFSNIVNISLAKVLDAHNVSLINNNSVLIAELSESNTIKIHSHSLTKKEITDTLT